MPVITIPFDFDPHGDGESTVPIYLNDTDENGEKIFFGWIEAVVPIQDKLKALSRRILGDVWGVSELTDITIQHLWRRHRENLGPHPSYRVYRTARRKAHGLEDPAAHGHLAIHVSMDRLEGFRRDALLCDTPDTEHGYRSALDLQLFEKKLNSEDLEIYRMLKAGYCWHEVAERIGRRPNTIHRRFSRTAGGSMDLCNYCFAKDFWVDERIPRKKVRPFTRRDPTSDTPELSESGTAGLPRCCGHSQPRRESRRHYGRGRDG